MSKAIYQLDHVDVVNDDDLLVADQKEGSSYTTKNLTIEQLKSKVATSVKVTSNQSTGNEIGTVTIDGVPTKLYTGPVGGGGGSVDTDLDWSTKEGGIDEESGKFTWSTQSGVYRTNSHTATRNEICYISINADQDNNHDITYVYVLPKNSSDSIKLGVLDDFESTGEVAVKLNNSLYTVILNEGDSIYLATDSTGKIDNTRCYWVSFEFHGVGGSGTGGSGGVIDGTKYIINPTGTGDDQYKVTKSLTVTDSTLVEAYTIQNDCGLYIESPFSSDVLYSGIRWYINDINSPIYSMAENQGTDRERQGVITFVKAGSKIYVNRPDNTQAQTGKFTFIEYKLNSLNPQVAFPDWSKTPTDIKSLIDESTESPKSYTLTSNGYLLCDLGDVSQQGYVYVDGIKVASSARYTYSTGTPGGEVSIVPVYIGNKITYSGTGLIIKLYPIKSVAQPECVSYVVESGKFSSVDGTTHSTASENDSWYRLYSDGWCEQGGYVPKSKFSSISTGGDKYTTNLNKSYKDLSYLVSGTVDCTLNSSGIDRFISTADRSINSFELLVIESYSSTSGDFYGATWKTEGYI